MIRKLRKGIRIIRRRLTEQGLSTTLVWLYARGLPAVTGIPILRFSKITEGLYVGPQFNANGLRQLKRNGINAIVNMRIEFDDAALGLVPEHYCYLPTIDDMAPSEEHLDIGIKFIQAVIDSGGKVYIHCGAGVGRAPTMAAAYLMSTGYSLEDAINTIRKTRPFIYIMPSQLEQLQHYVLSLTRR
jgi:protein tyrosine phosphatase (PTP) superfamily phosphohydrolase (DUF442 family)